MFKKAIFALALAGALNAGEVNRSSAFDFTTIRIDAVSASLGGAASLIPGPGTAHWGNPALLAAWGKNSWGGAWFSHTAGIMYGGVTGSYRFKNGIAAAPSFRYLTAGGIAAYDQNGDPLAADVSPFSIDAGAAVSYSWIPAFSTGMTVRGVYEYLAPELIGISDRTDASALMFDGGIYFTPARFLALSAGIRNAGFFLKRYENDSSEIPVSLYTGIRYFTRGSTPGHLLLELEKENNFPLFIRPALEVQFLREIISLRAGTAVSSDDIRRFAEVIGGDAGQKSDYTQTHESVLSLGAGISVPVQDKKIFFDGAAKLLGDDMGVNLVFSGGFSF